MEQKENKRILVKFKDERASEDIKEAMKERHSLKKLHTKKKLTFTKAELLEVHEEDDLGKVVEDLQSRPDVHYAQEDHKLFICAKPVCGKFNDQWGLYNSGQEDKYGNEGKSGIDINIMPAWEITRGAETTVVAVIDTGIDINHIDLWCNIYHNPGETEDGLDDDGNNYCDDITGWDFANKDNSVYDSAKEDMHGTLVAGIISAYGDASGIIGVAPAIKVMPLKFMTAEHGYTSAAIEAIEYAKMMGVKIVNCSWGDFAENDALKYHIENSDMLFICAAGNGGMDLANKPFYPACYDLPNILSVAAVNNKGKLWPLSNYGDKIHIAAPGASILSTVSSDDEKIYDYNCGTSMAAPYVTGIAALLLSVDRNMTAKEIKRRIEQNVTELPELKGKVRSGGMANAYKALVGK